MLHDFVIGSDYLDWQETYAAHRQCQQGVESWSNRYLTVLRSDDKGFDKELTDEQWMIIAPLFQETSCLLGRYGRPRRTSRHVLNGILWRLRRGARWQDLPKRFPAVQTCHTKFKQWVGDGTLRRVLELLAGDLEKRGEVNLAEGFVDGTYFFVKERNESQAPQSGGKIAPLWVWQTFMLLISPATRRLLLHTRSPLAKKIFSKTYTANHSNNRARRIDAVPL